MAVRVASRTTDGAVSSSDDTEDIRAFIFFEIFKPFFSTYTRVDGLEYNLHVIFGIQTGSPMRK